MNTIQWQKEQTAITPLPELAVSDAELPELTISDAERAISLINRWLHGDVGMLIHVSRATYDPVTYCWHLPVELAFPDTGSVGKVGDVYLHAVSGQFISMPDTATMEQEALALAKLHGLLEENDDEEAGIGNQQSD